MLTLGLVAGLALAGAARTRGARNGALTLYHVTTREAADDILRSGFLPGWGDIGLGTYFYGSEREAMRYGQRGGWDGALRGEQVVILAVRDPRIRRIHASDLDPSWDSAKYADMWFWGSEDEDAYMVPERVAVHADLGKISKAARKGSASLNLRGARNAGETLRNDLLPATLRDTHDLVVTEDKRRVQHWEPTGVGSGVVPVVYTYHTLVAALYPRGKRDKDVRLGQVGASSERKAGVPVKLRGRCADDLVRLGGPDYAFAVTGAFVDEGLRGKGVGQAMYAALVEAAGAHGGALTSNRCLTGTELTSADALRVWERLGRRYRVEGEVAWQPKGSAARRGSRDTDDGFCDGPYIHVTPARNADAILRHGLEPFNVRALRQNPEMQGRASRTIQQAEYSTLGVVGWSRDKVFFGQGDDIALEWAVTVWNNTGETEFAAFRLRDGSPSEARLREDARGTKDIGCSFYIDGTVPPSDLVRDARIERMIRRNLTEMQEER